MAILYHNGNAVGNDAPPILRKIFRSVYANRREKGRPFCPFRPFGLPALPLPYAPDRLGYALPHLGGAGGELFGGRRAAVFFSLAAGHSPAPCDFR